MNEIYQLMSELFKGCSLNGQRLTSHFQLLSDAYKTDGHFILGEISKLLILVTLHGYNSDRVRHSHFNIKKCLHKWMPKHRCARGFLFPQVYVKKVESILTGMNSF